MPFLLSTQNFIIAAVLAFVLGCSTGMYVKSQFAKADQFEAVIETQHETAKDIKQSLEIDSVAKNEVTASNQQIATIRKVVVYREKAKVIENAENNHSAGDCSLDIGTVGLLNTARTGIVGATELSDAEGKASSGIGQAELIDNDLEVVGLYRDLAIIHDKLVDYVESKVKKQAE